MQKAFAFPLSYLTPKELWTARAVCRSCRDGVDRSPLHAETALRCAAVECWRSRSPYALLQLLHSLYIRAASPRLTRKEAWGLAELADRVRCCDKRRYPHPVALAKTIAAVRVDLEGYALIRYVGRLCKYFACNSEAFFTKAEVAAMLFEVHRVQDAPFRFFCWPLSVYHWTVRLPGTAERRAHRRLLKSSTANSMAQNLARLCVLLSSTDAHRLIYSVYRIEDDYLYSRDCVVSNLTHHCKFFLGLFVERVRAAFKEEVQAAAEAACTAEAFSALARLRAKEEAAARKRESARRTARAAESEGEEEGEGKEEEEEEEGKEEEEEEEEQEEEMAVGPWSVSLFPHQPQRLRRHRRPKRQKQRARRLRQKQRR